MFIHTYEQCMNICMNEYVFIQLLIHMYESCMNMYTKHNMFTFIHMYESRTTICMIHIQMHARVHGQRCNTYCNHIDTNDGEYVLHLKFVHTHDHTHV